MWGKRGDISMKIRLLIAACLGFLPYATLSQAEPHETTPVRHLAASVLSFEFPQSTNPSDSVVRHGLRAPASALGAMPPKDSRGEAISPNYSGYFVTKGPYRSASGSWTVPQVTYAKYPDAPQKEWSSTWVGIGNEGDDLADSSLIQLGTSQNVFASGDAEYTAWYELLPDTQKLLPTQFKVSPGDQITASIECKAACVPNQGQQWTLTMSNTTKGWTWTSDQAYPSSMGSAEWIQEATLVGLNISKLPKFDSVAFKNLRANGVNPNLSLPADAQVLIDPNDDTPLSRPLAPTGGDAFIVKQVGLIPAPITTPGHLACTSAADLGDLSANPSTRVQGNLPAPNGFSFFRFYVNRYFFVTTVPIGPKFDYQIVDDLTGRNLSLLDQNNIGLSLDPGFYCLKVFNPQGTGATNFALSLQIQLAGILPGHTQPTAQFVASMELGNLTSNGYYAGSRYLNTLGGIVLQPSHEYVVRDWLGMATGPQYYRFALADQRTVELRLDNLYAGADVVLLTDDGILVDGTDGGNASPIGGLVPSQQHSGSLPAGRYYIRINYRGLVAPGTPFQLWMRAL
jgi:Peptidase A4 family